ncbi:MAG: hypothetical protein IJN49_01135, partial [Clostridia bacterium]|nr:hypothetical protein [Clostridia bacterium]
YLYGLFILLHSIGFFFIKSDYHYYGRPQVCPYDEMIKIVHSFITFQINQLATNERKKSAPAMVGADLWSPVN